MNAKKRKTARKSKSGQNTTATEGGGGTMRASRFPLPENLWVELSQPSDKVADLVAALLRCDSGETGTQTVKIEEAAWFRCSLEDMVSRLDPGFDYEADSTQRRLIQALDEKYPEKNVLHQFDSAKKVREKALLDLACRSLTGKKYSEILALNGWISLPQITKLVGVPGATFVLVSPSIATPASAPEHDLGLRKLVIEHLLEYFPDKVLGSQDFINCMVSVLRSGNGRDYFMRMASRIGRREQKKKILGIDKLEIVLTTNFTNPEFPLWLATKKALASILRIQFGLADVTEESAAKMRSRKLKTESPYSIIDVKQFRDKDPEMVFAEGIREKMSPKTGGTQ